MYINLTMFFHILSVDIQGLLIAQIHKGMHFVYKIKRDKLHLYFYLNFKKK